MKKQNKTEINKISSRHTYRFVWSHLFLTLCVCVWPGFFTHKTLANQLSYWFNEVAVECKAHQWRNKKKMFMSIDGDDYCDDDDYGCDDDDDDGLSYLVYTYTSG